MELFIHRGFESDNGAKYKFSDLISDGEGGQLMAEVSMAEPLDSKEVVTTQELAACNMLETGARRKEDLGLSMAEIARHLGAVTSSITRAIEKMVEGTG